MVRNIDITDHERVKVSFENDLAVKTDLVLVTVSLGYLKEHYSTLFTPKVPEEKINGKFRRVLKDVMASKLKYSYS